MRALAGVNIRHTLARVVFLILLAETLAFLGEDVGDKNEQRRDRHTDLEGDLIDILVVVGGVLVLVPPLKVVLVLKQWLPGAVATTVDLVLAAVVVVLATSVIMAVHALVINTAVRAVPSLNGRGEGGDRKDHEREESSD